jgi:hypothetical protein
MPSNDPELQPSEPRDGLCNDTDGFSVCTENPRHRLPHYDARTQHEWAGDAFGGEQRSGNLFDQAF